MGQCEPIEAEPAHDHEEVDHNQHEPPGTGNDPRAERPIAGRTQQRRQRVEAVKRAEGTEDRPARSFADYRVSVDAEAMPKGVSVRELL